jgi:hypothetical protein
LVGTDVSSLRRCHAPRFDRFEIHSKLRPILDELKQSHSRLDGLMSPTNTSFKRLSEQVKTLSDSVAAATAKVQSDQTRFAADVVELEPKLVQLGEQQAPPIAMMRVSFHPITAYQH